MLGALDALGHQNSVSWRAALDGRAPKIAALGSGNAIAQLR